MKLKKLRKLLNKNIIFLHVFQGVGLGIFAVMLTYWGIQNDEREILINQQQLLLNEHDYKLKELEYSPRIVMQEWYYEDGNGDRGIEGIDIINKGYPVNNFKDDFYTFIRINKMDKDLQMLSSVLVPVRGYVGVGSLYKNSIGELATYAINNKLFNQLQYQSALELNADGEVFYDLEKVVLLKVQYLDYKNELITKYYCDDNANRGSEISKELALQIIELDDEKKSFYLDEITPVDLINIIARNEHSNPIL